MSNRGLLLVLLLAMALSCCACGGDIEAAPVKPDTENIPSDDNTDNENEGGNDNTSVDAGEDDKYKTASYWSDYASMIEEKSF